MAGNTIYLDVVIDDNGTTRRVAVDANRLADAMGRAAKGSAEADRNIKGAAQASSNATKNFSKMSQGMGGLVAAYATVAAQVFALSAAYQFLVQAADFRILIEGQKALTEQTGVAYTSITRSIQAATSAQLGYKEAAQAAAIGTAAGLSATMLKDIASYSQTISAVLGRDLEDTFNRLIRGITKAEPELLDELGIVLRLSDASSEYARTLGKTASELTAYEKTQGVALNTLSQIEEKYGALNESGELSANGIRQLGAAFSELGNKIFPAVSVVAEGLANSIRDNVAAVVSAFGLLLGGVIKQALPDMESILKSTDASIQSYSEKIAEYTIQADSFARGQRTITESVRPAVENLQKLASSIKEVQGAGAPAIADDLLNIAVGDKFDPGQVTAMMGQIDDELQAIATGAARSPLLESLSKEQLEEAKEGLGSLRDEAEQASEGMRGALNRVGDQAKETATRTQLVWAKAMRGMQRATQVAVRGMNIAFKALGIIGLLVTLWGLLSSVTSWIIDFAKSFSKEEPKEVSLAERLVGSKEEVEAAKARIEDLARQGKALEKVQKVGTFERIATVGGNVSLNISSVVEELKNQNKEYLSSLLKINEDITRIEEARQKLNEEATSKFYDPKVAQKEKNDILKRGRELNEENRKARDARDKLNQGFEGNRRNLALELLAYAKAIPELQQYTAEIEKSIDTNNYGALANSKAAEVVLKTAENYVKASGAIKAFREGYETLSKQIIDSAPLDEIQKRYVLLNNTLLQLKTAFQASADNGKLLGTDLEKLDTTGVELGRSLNKLKKLLDNTFNLKVQEQNLTKLSNQLGLFFSQSDAAIELLNEQDIKKAQLEIAKINDQLDSLEVNKDLFDIFTGQNKKILEKAVGEPIGQSVLAAGAANADQLSTKFTEASNGFIQQYKDENDSYFLRLAELRGRDAPKRPEEVIVTSASAQSEAQKNTTDTNNIELDTDAEKNLRNLTFARNKLLLEQQKIQFETTQYINIQVQAARRYTDYANKTLEATKQQRSLELQILNIGASLEDKLANQIEYDAKTITYNKEQLDLARAANRVAEAGIQADIDRAKVQGQGQSESVKRLEESLARLKEINTAEEYRIELQNKLEALQAKEAQRQSRLNILKQELDATVTLLNVQEELSNLSNPYVQQELRERLQIEKTTASLLALEKEIQYTSKEQLPALKNKIIEEKARLTVLQEQEKELNKISQAVKGAFGEGIEQEIAAFLKGGQVDIETSFLNIVKSVGEAAADQMAKTATNFILDGLGLGEESEAEQINAAMKEAANYADSKISAAMISAGDSSAEQLKAALAEAEALISSSLKMTLTEGADSSSNTIKTAMEEAARYTADLIKKAHAQVQPKMPMEEQKEEAKLPAAPQAVKVSGIKQVSGVDSVSNPTAVPSSSQSTVPSSSQSTVPSANQPVAPLSVKVTGIEELEACIVRALSTGATTVEQKINTGLSNGATTVEQAIIRAFENVTLPSIKEVESVSKPTPPPEVDTASLSVKVTGIEELEACIVRALSTGALEVERAIGRAFQNANLSIKPPALPTSNDNPLIQEVQVTPQRPPVPDKSSTTSVGMTIANGAKKIGTDIRNFGNQVQETFASDAPFLDKLGSIFSADAPWINSMTRGLAGALGGIAVGALSGGGGGNVWRNAIIGGVVSGLSMGFSAWMGGLSSQTPAAPGASTLQVTAMGGIMQGGFRAFAKGGIVTRPTFGLVGEGKYNEAVVPLPDGKSIPVIMQSGGGDRNNIGININVNSNGQMQNDTQATGERAVAMAQAIQNVVQLELKRQKRPGGLLSPF